MLQANTPIKKLGIVSTKLSQALASSGITTVSDLLYYFPNRYEDYSEFKEISALEEGKTVTIKGQILEIKSQKTWKKKLPITEAVLQDETGFIKATWFGRLLPLKFLSKGKYLQLSGKVSMGKNGKLYFSHPNFEIINKSSFESEMTVEDSVSTGGLLPIYPESKGITSFWLRKITKYLLDNTILQDSVPLQLLEEESLPELNQALKNIHFPEDQSAAEQAKRRFAFEKMLFYQIYSLQTKKAWDENHAPSIPFNQEFIKKFVSGLPFQLTNAQKISTWQIIKDLERSKPMNRLLQGDVGSGKTVVAIIAAMSAAKEGFQVAIMAPTEVLAKQHYANINRSLDGKFKIALLTSSSSIWGDDKITKVGLRTLIADHKVDLIIGTHALITEKTAFAKLGLVIIDEQHRFGVNQRAKLLQQTMNTDDGAAKTIPHLLTMTATPIPRTLSLALFGNLDLSIIDEYPKGRKTIITKVISPKNRRPLYKFLKKEIQKGRQVFVICPLVEESSKISELKAAKEEQELLKKNIFPELKIGLLHGKMKAQEKDEVMKSFKDQEIDILVSTSVIEVGVDIPNASVILIEGAERFGLSQLHQFRGRVGRGAHQSYCFLLPTDEKMSVSKRLSALEKTNDGFKLSQIDLELRGPGQFIGTMQSGTADIAMESLSDIKLIQKARLAAQRILLADSSLNNYPELKNAVQAMKDKIHQE